MPEAGSVGIVVGDRRPVLRAGIERTIEAAPGLSVAGSAAREEDALALVERRRPALLVIPRGLAACEREVVSHAEISGAGVVFYDEAVTADCVIDAVAAGARGYLSLLAPAEVFGAVLRRAATGEVALCPAAQQAVAERSLQFRAATVRLTVREDQILRMLAAGGSVGTIAADLVVSENTVKTHKRTLYAKVGAVNGASLVVNAVALGLLELPFV